MRYYNRMNNICFFSTNHLGDILLSNPFIKKICESNPDQQFYQWSLYGNELLCGPTNLNYLIHINNDNYNGNFLSGLAPEDFIQNDYLKQLFIKNHSVPIVQFTYENKNYIGFNTWCIPLGCNEDVNIEQLMMGYRNNIQQINHIFNTNYKIDPYKKWDLLPYLKDIPINNFINWKNSLDNSVKLIYIYNYAPRLVKLNFDINTFIIKVCNLYKNSIIIVPLYDIRLKDIPNIKFCDKDFDCKNVISGINLLMINKINYKCDVIISLPTGGSWCWFNNDFKYSKPKIYMLQGNCYVNKLNKWYEYATNEKNIVYNLDPNNNNELSNILN